MGAVLCRVARSANCLSRWHGFEPAAPHWVLLLFLETERSLISVEARRSIGSQELCFPTKAKFCSCASLLPPFPSSCWIWTPFLTDTSSCVTVPSNYTSNSGVRDTDFQTQTHTQAASRVHSKTRPWHLLFFPCVAFTWKECVWVEMWCLSAHPHPERQRSGTSVLSTLCPGASLPKAMLSSSMTAFLRGSRVRI